MLRRRVRRPAERYTPFLQPQVLGTMRSDQKDEERFFVTRLFEALEIPLRTLVPADPAPDFVAKHRDGSAGIEVTTLFRPHGMERPRQAIESERRAVVETAGEIWDARGEEAVSVLVHFNRDHHITRTDRDRLAMALVEMVAAHQEQRVRLEFDWVNREWFPEEFAFVRIFRSDILTRAHWTVSDASYVPWLKRENMVAAIQAKAVPDYSTDADESWLLLVMDTFRHSSSFQVSEEVLARPYSSPFDRLYLLDVFAPRAWELPSDDAQSH